MAFFSKGYKLLLPALLVGVTLFLQCCIKNDLPYPRIPQMILALSAEGQTKEAYIDSLAFEVNVYLDETVDIEQVRFTEFRVAEGATADPDLLDGTYNMSTPLYVNVSLYQDYSWEIIAHQDIERYFDVAGEIGTSTIDPVGHRVIVNMPLGTDLSKLTLQRVKLGPAGISTMSPDLKPGLIDLLYPMKVDVTCHDRTETWTIYAQLTETVVNTTQVDAWSQVIWAYGACPADAKGGFEYRLASEIDWKPVPSEYVTQTQGNFSCYIPHLEPDTEYAVRAIAGEDTGNEVRVTTQPTADIPDGDFEQWCQTTTTLGKLMWCPWADGGERFWDTGNGGSITMDVNLTTPTDHTVTGAGKAAKCETKFVGLGAAVGKLGSGSIFTGDYLRTEGTNGVLGFGRRWELRPTKLRGYYQYSAVDISHVSTEFQSLKGQPDTCHIYVALTDWTAPYEIRTKPSDRQLFDKNADYVIAYGELVYSGKMSAYEPFEIKLNYRDTSRIPSYLQITCSASKYGDYFTGGSGSVLYVDQFSFDYDY